MDQWLGEEKKNHFNWVLAVLSFLMGKEGGVRGNEGMEKRRYVRQKDPASRFFWAPRNVFGMNV